LPSDDREPQNAFRGVVYRATHPDYEDLDRTIEVSKRYPSRFNPLGHGAVYVALERTTAVAELKRRAEKLGRQLTSFAPRALLTLDVALRQVLDLTDAAVRAEWDITPDDLGTEFDYERCHEVAEVARRDGYEAIRFPSATGDGVNLVVFYDQLHAGSYVVVRASEKLDLDGLA
jgi:RES domain-containing protein